MNTILLIIFCASVSFLSAQNPIPNPGFENWNGPEVINWTHNSSGYTPTVVQTSDAYSGSYAVKGEVIEFAGAELPPTFFTGSYQDNRFSVTSRYQTFTGQYKFEGVDGNMLYIEVVFVNDKLGGGGEGHAQIGTDATSYTEIEIPIIYGEDNPPGWVPTHANITVTIQPEKGKAPHKGTYFVVDHFSFDGNPVE